MPVVTALRSARSGRIAVEIDGKHAFTVTQSLVARRRLHVDRRLDEADLTALADEARRETALADAHRLLAHRSRSRRELHDRLSAKGHPLELIDRILADLDAEGIVDDGRFAAAFVADKRRLAGWGRERIARELARAGVDRRVAEDALGPDEHEDEVGRALKVLAKKTCGRPTGEKERKRAYDALRRRGFSVAVAYEAVARRAAAADAHDDDGHDVLDR